MAKSYSGGLWVVVKGEKQWANWRDWMIKHRRAVFFPDHMTVLGEFPPETPDGNKFIMGKLDYFVEMAANKGVGFSK